MITLSTGVGNLFQEVRPLKRTKFLAVHASVDYTGRYDITHLPTGFRICSCNSLPNAKAFLERIKDLDWSFKSALDKPQGLSQQMRDAFTKFRADFGNDTLHMR